MEIFRLTPPPQTKTESGILRAAWAALGVVGKGGRLHEKSTKNRNQQPEETFWKGMIVNGIG